MASSTRTKPILGTCPTSTSARTEPLLRKSSLRISLGEASGRLNILDADGSALIIHASPDDHSSQPIGGAGARIACAPIR